MNRAPASLAILCLEDEREVLKAIIRDLAPFEEKFRIEPASNVSEAREILVELKRGGHPLALALCDHLLPGTTGTEFLVELNKDPATQPARKVLITAHAGLQETIQAVNEAGLNYYISKPWTAEQLQQVVRDELTAYILQQKINPIHYLAILNTPQLAQAIATSNLETDT